MRVPTTDYSPIINAVRANTQAQQTQFIAPQIDYARKSSKNQNRMLILQKKGLELQQVSNIVNTGFGLVNSGIDLMQNMYQDQKFQANKTLQQNAKETSSAILSGLANQSIWVDEQGNVNGMDTLNSLKESQLAAVDDKKWFKSVKREYSEGLDNIYADSQRAILDQANRNAIESNFQHQQDLIGQYEKIDAARIDGKPGEEYRLTDGLIDSWQGYSQQQKDEMKFNAHANIDWMKAQNSVSAAARSGSYDDAVKVADKWVDDKSYTEEQREALYGIAARMTRQAEAKAEAIGTQFMTQQIESGTIGKEAWDNIEEQIKGLPENQKEAYKRAAERVHIGKLLEINTKALDGIDAMSPDDIKLALSDLKDNKYLYEGTPATMEKYFALQEAYGKQLKEYGVAEEKLNKELTEAEKNEIKDFRSNQLAILETLIPQWEAGELTGQEVIDNCNIEIGNANSMNRASEYYTDADEAKVFSTAQKIINKVKDKLPPSKKEIFDRHYNDIGTQIMKYWFNEDNVKNLSDEQKKIIADNQKWIMGKMIDKCRNNKISDEDFEKEIENDINKYQVNLYSEFSKDLIVNTNATKEEAAMARTEAFQTKGQVYYNTSTGNFSFPPGLSEQYDNSARIEKNMIRDNYGIDVEDNYSIKDLEGNAVPVFHMKGNSGPDITVYNGQVYKWYSHGQLVPVARKKEFTRDGYEDIGVRRNLLSDPNLDKQVISSTTKNAYQEAVGGR